jgi:hypothetical protein
LPAVVAVLGSIAAEYWTQTEDQAGLAAVTNVFSNKSISSDQINLPEQSLSSGIRCSVRPNTVKAFVPAVITATAHYPDSVYEPA